MTDRHGVSDVTWLCVGLPGASNALILKARAFELVAKEYHPVELMINFFPGRDIHLIGKDCVGRCHVDKKGIR